MTTEILRPRYTKQGTVIRRGLRVVFRATNGTVYHGCIHQIDYNDRCLVLCDDGDIIGLYPRELEDEAI